MNGVRCLAWLPPHALCYMAAPGNDTHATAPALDTSPTRPLPTLPLSPAPPYPRLSFRTPAVLAASPFNWPRLLSGRHPTPQLLLEFSDAAKPAGPSTAPGRHPRHPHASAGGRLVSMGAPQRREYMEQQVASVVESVLGVRVAADAPLMESGLDSLGAVELRSALETRLDLRLPATLVFDHPTRAALVGALVAAAREQQGAGQEEGEASEEATGFGGSRAGGLQARGVRAPVLAGVDRGLLVVSAVVERLPCGARCGGGAMGSVVADAIRVVPLERWDVEIGLAEERPARFGAFMQGAEVRAGARGL